MRKVEGDGRNDLLSGAATARGVRTGYEARAGAFAETLEPIASAPLAAFLAAYETGSIQGAADALSLTQSAVSKRIQALERRLGARVLERGRHGARPTAFGQAIYPGAKQALSELQRLALLSAQASRRQQQQLQLSASHTIGEFLLPPWLSMFRRLAPEVQPQLEIVHSQGALDAVRSGRAAVGFVEAEGELDDLETTVIAHDTLVAVVAAGHRWASRRSLSAAELLRERYLTRERGSGTREVAAARLLSSGVELVPSFEAASTQALKRALSDEGFTIISSLAIEEERRAGTHVALPIRGVSLARELRAVRRRRPAPEGPARRFWRWLAERATDTTEQMA